MNGTFPQLQSTGMQRKHQINFLVVESRRTNETDNRAWIYLRRYPCLCCRSPHQPGATTNTEFVLPGYYGQVFNLLQQDKSDEAIDYMFSTNPAMQQMTDKKTQLKVQFASLQKLVGHYVSHAQLVESKVTGLFVYQHYFVAYEREPLSIRIMYYRPDTSWHCYSLQFDDKTDELIRNQADDSIAGKLK